MPIVLLARAGASVVGKALPGSGVVVPVSSSVIHQLPNRLSFGAKFTSRSGILSMSGALPSATATMGQEDAGGSSHTGFAHVELPAEPPAPPVAPPVPAPPEPPLPLCPAPEPPPPEGDPPVASPALPPLALPPVFAVPPAPPFVV